MIKVKKVNAAITYQFKFLKKFEIKLYKSQFRKLSIWLALFTCVYLLINILPDEYAFIVIKAIASILFFLSFGVIIISLMWLSIKFAAFNKSVKNLIKTTINSDVEYEIEFNEEVFSVRAKDVKIEYDWAYFKAYLFHDGYVFLFPEGSVFQAHSYSANEIGEDNLNALKTIVSQKVKYLETSN